MAAISSSSEFLGHFSLEVVQPYARIAEVDAAAAHRLASPADNWSLFSPYSTTLSDSWENRDRRYKLSSGVSGGDFSIDESVFHPSVFPVRLAPLAGIFGTIPPAGQMGRFADGQTGLCLRLHLVLH